MPLPDDLPPHLAERCHHLNDRPVRGDAEFVLCWLHHAIRDHENPALDTAITVANPLGLPVLVYQGLAGRHRFNSDRHHVFIMQGARELSAGLRARGIAYAFHAPIDTDTPSPLYGLIERAAAFITEDFPAPPFPAWTRAHAARAECAAIAVDSACIMPIRTLTKRFTRAFAFRDAAKDEWEKRVVQPWPEVEPKVRASEDLLASVGFEPFDVEHADLGAHAADCSIDHSIPPVTHLEGGMTAGGARWAEFKSNHLRRYHNRRNDASDMDAVSGLSPFLHHGHVSPFTVAREATKVGGKGAEKFLDELLVWRELAFNFCVNTPGEKLETLDALPDWAARTLAEHSGDARDAAYTWDTLLNARTTDDLWNAAQRSLLRNGELHNNLRMTWGKMIPRWTPSPEDALRTLIDLNHRLALDGNNPNSYGGLLWCLGQFDRPFKPEKPILGTIRDRTTDIHADRLPPERMEAAIADRHLVEPLRVAIVGGGIAGLACARVLRDQGCEVTVYDRGRRVGGRMATRDDAERGLALDHGVPCFRVTDARFGRYVRAWIRAGVCAPWSPEIVGGPVPTKLEPPLVVATPSMRSLCEHLSSGLPCRVSTTVTKLERTDDAWRVTSQRYGEDEAAPETFDAVVVAAAPHQIARLLPDPADSIRDRLLATKPVPTWVAMFTLDRSAVGTAGTTPDVILAEDPDGPVSMIVRDDTKPGRATDESRSAWVAHSTAAWAKDRLEMSPDDALEALLPCIQSIMAEHVGDETRNGASMIAPLAAHRWSMAGTEPMISDESLADASLRLAVCGDGFGQRENGGGVEAAFLSGHAAAGRILAMRSRRAAALF